MSRGSAPDSPEPRGQWYIALAVGVVVAGLIGLAYYWKRARTNRQGYKIDRIEDQRAQGRSGNRSASDPRSTGAAGRRTRKPSSIELQRNRIRMAALQQLLQLRRKGAPNVDGGAKNAIDPKLRARYELALARDKLRYNAREMAAIDSLYGKAIDGRDSKEGTAAVQELMDSFPNSNRTDCAAMNLAASKLNDGKYDEAATYLEGLINGNSSAVFGNGERVLPKALFNYGLLQQDQGNAEKARAAWQRIVDEFPNEQDSSGTPYGALAEQALKKK